ncbi:hypothetical protein [Nitratireductor sp. XY-223]|uniref:hypothetical protein n=1 Tax=Nitratireductor sp. XY-223 TaxID=2561926 RepID=UPI0010AB4B6B|nr:hypothetical protein [Nitratireductor sp. XY-223]
MSGSNAKSSAIAAAIILVAVAAGFLAMPRIVLTLGDISPWLGYGVATLFILGFFAIFWLRARYQRRRDEPTDTV